MLRIAEHFHDSDLGRQRQGNEDNFFVRAPLFVVADGMGGAQAGEVASELAVGQFEGGLPDGRRPASRSSELIHRRTPQIHDSRAETPSGPGWAPPSPRPTSTATMSSSPTSATARYLCATAP